MLPVVNLMGYQKQTHGNWIALSVVSMIACAISLCFQIFYNAYLVQTEDWSALMDTSYATASAAAVLLIVTILLNVISCLCIVIKWLKSS
nr:hypothetical protein [Psychrobacillus lasiicapitis]